jgi:hypothetical protein
MIKVNLGPTIALLVPGLVFSHHSQAPYDMASEVIIDGTVVELEWRNPHIAMMLEVIGEDGEPFLQEVEMASVSEVRALGIDEAAIPVGAHVALQAHPGRRGPGSRVFGLALTRSDGTRVPLHPFAGFANIPDTDAEASGLAGRWAPSAEGLTDVFDVMLSWPYTDAAGAALQDTSSREGSSLGVCEDFPPPLVSIFPDLREIDISATSVVMRFESQGQNLERVVRLNEMEHSVDVEPSLVGDSIGWWEGETLVVDSIAFTPHPHGAFAWVQSGPNKHLVERFTLASDRRHLQYEVAMEDPESLTGPANLSMLWDYRPDLAPSGLACDPEIAERFLSED